MGKCWTLKAGDWPSMIWQKTQSPRRAAFCFNLGVWNSPSLDWEEQFEADTNWELIEWIRGGRRWELRTARRRRWASMSIFIYTNLLCLALFIWNRHVFRLQEKGECWNRDRERETDREEFEAWIRGRRSWERGSLDWLRPLCGDYGRVSALATLIHLLELTSIDKSRVDNESAMPPCLY